jgi:hypothetical protein
MSTGANSTDFSLEEDEMQVMRFRNKRPVISTPKRSRTEEFSVVAITAAAIFGPVVLLCLVSGQLWPLFLMAGSDVVGATLGVRSFNKTDRQVVLQLNIAQPKPEVAEDEDVFDLKKAA